MLYHVAHYSGSRLRIRCVFEGHLADEAKISLTWDIETQVLLLARVADPDPVG